MYKLFCKGLEIKAIIKFKCVMLQSLEFCVTLIQTAYDHEVDAMVYLTLVYHHGGSLVTKDDGSVAYEVDNVDVQDRLDEDTLDVYAVRGHHHALGYPKIAQCRWLIPGSPLETGLRVITDDVHLLEMCRLARGNNNRVDIYYEHVVSEPQVEEDVPELIELTPNSVTMDQVPSPMTNTPTKVKQRVKIVLPKSPLKSKSPSKHQPNSTPNPATKPETSSKPTPNPALEAQTFSRGDVGWT
ncbi:hypothetical protein PIB30_074494 [Stylosanthes scabra]|uniref:PB1-like domain-containing protein n=1 Tax=Stylosanthes scabra TaxID=79078 RepID=A0ABU6UQT1_9FABA|nr:hypothetical protein [Stylosanthes scabra]